MSKHPFKRGLTFGLALVLALSALPVSARAAETDGLCEHHTAHDEACGYIATEDLSCFYAANGCEQCEAENQFTLIELVATDITLDKTVFEYTGEAITPNVTVRANGTLLTLGKDYTMTFADNVEPGTARVIVTGIATASETVGYTGTVEHPFYINPKADAGSSAVEIKGTDVTISGSKFDYTGEAIEPEVTVTVNGQTLTAGTDYALTYENNVEPGTATAVVTGITTENGGYTGEVRINFTIVKEEEETVPPTETQPEETEPEETEPETSEPEQTEPEKVTYEITKGSKSTWYRESGKRLSFTANGKFEDFTGISIDGEKLDSKHYSVKSGSTVVSLKSDYLEELSLGKHTITIHFEDGDAEGVFRVSRPADESNPKTGDSIHLWVAVLFTTLVILAALAFVFRKKIFK